MSSESDTTLIIFDLGFIDDIDAAIQGIADNWAWILAEGIINVVFGVIAIMAPILATASVALYVHSAIMISGLVHISGLIFAERGFRIRSFLVGVLQLSLGAVLEYYPLESLVTVTTLIASVMMVDGTYRTVMANQNRDLPGWFWTSMGGVLSVTTGFVVLATLPTSSLDTIGTLVGIHLLSVGPTRIKIAKLGREIALLEKED